MRKSRFLVFLVVVFALAGAISTQAQDKPIITLVVPEFWRNLVQNPDSLVANFESQNNVDVQIKFTNNDLGNAPTDASSVDSYKDNLVAYLQLGDVVYADQSWLTPEVTRPGFVMDLMPLINADTNLNPDDFHAAVWQSFQWDGGMWAMPTSASALFVDYIPQSFDDVGIAYPSTSWTIDDFATAVRALTQYDENKQVSLPGAQVSNQARAALFYAFLGHGFYDSSSFPDTPSLNSPDLAHILDVWNQLLTDGVLVAGGGGPGGGFGRGNNDIPIRIGSGGLITVAISDSNAPAAPGGFNFNANAPQRAAAPLSNGLTSLQANGFAISSGTQNPQLAYQLVRYLSEQKAVANADVGSDAARKSYANDAPTDTGIVINVQRSTDQEALVQDALDNGVPTSELRFSQYLSAAVSEVRNGTDAATALQDAELNAQATVDAMSALQVNFTVDTPLILTVPQNEIVLDFQMAGFGPGLANQDQWDALAKDFSAQDPEVGAVNIDVLGGRQIATDSPQCTYYSNTAFITVDPDTMLALDPLLFSDMNYNVNDLPAGVLNLMQINGMTYGLPMTLQPLMMNYNSDMFAQAGVPDPVGGWTISDFENALQMLQSVVQTGDPSFSPQGNTTAAILMLIAAQGGNPIDFSTTPPTLNFSSPENVAAIQAVLDWAKNGLIEYNGTGGFGGGGDGPGGGFGPNNAIPIRSSFFGGFGGRVFFGGNNNNSQKLTTYPTGIYDPVALDVGAGYVGKDFANPEACYRWLSYVATHPYVFTNAMPALLSMLNDQQVMDTLGTDTVAAYQQVADMLNSPSALLSINANDPFIFTWLGRAFDAYVQNGDDLATQLQLAEQSTKDYMTCTANLDASATRRDLQTCVQTVDSATS